MVTPGAGRPPPLATPLASLTVWNSLPQSLREIENLDFFKKRLKAYQFNLAFEDVTTV